jgi:hypothetical protein
VRPEEPRGGILWGLLAALVLAWVIDSVILSAGGCGGTFAVEVTRPRDGVVRYGVGFGLLFAVLVIAWVRGWRR